MIKSIHTKIKSSSTRSKVFIVLIIVILLAITGAGLYFYKVSQDYKSYNEKIILESEELKKSLDELNAKYENILKEVDLSQKDKMSLIQAFNQVGVEYNSLMQNYNLKISEVSKLEKTVMIDDELLKKYSKYYFLNENYMPASTTEINPEFTLNKKSISILLEVKPKLEQMIQDAKNASTTLVVNSGYRSFKEQKGLKGVYVQKYGLSASNQFSADQGYSEHQLGTAVDINDGSYDLSISFDKTKSFAWLKDNSHRYGFILSYPKGNTYYVYEPWHYRYVGVELATYLKSNNLNFYDLDQKFIDSYKIKIFE